MINMISQLVAQQGAEVNASLAAIGKKPVATIAENKSQEEVTPEVHGRMDALSAEKLAGAVNQLNGYMEGTQRGLRFSIDDDSGRTVVRVVDTETDEIIRQIPSEEILAVIRNLSDITGKILDEVT